MNGSCRRKDLNNVMARGLMSVALLAAALTIPVVAHSANVGSLGSAGNILNHQINGVWFVPTSGWDVGRRDLTTTYSNGVAATISNSFGPTRLNVGLFSPTSCGSTYEVCVFDINYGNNGVLGWNQCVGTVVGADPLQTCSQQWVRINLDESPPAQRIACHELAHAVGLRHTAEQASCVKATINGGNSSFLSGHDIEHINIRY